MPGREISKFLSGRKKISKKFFIQNSSTGYAKSKIASKKD